MWKLRCGGQLWPSRTLILGLGTPPSQGSPIPQCLSLGHTQYEPCFVPSFIVFSAWNVSLNSNSAFFLPGLKIERTVQVPFLPIRKWNQLIVQIFTFIAPPIFASCSTHHWHKVCSVSYIIDATSWLATSRFPLAHPSYCTLTLNWTWTGSPSKEECPMQSGTDGHHIFNNGMQEGKRKDFPHMFYNLMATFYWTPVVLSSVFVGASRHGWFTTEVTKNNLWAPHVCHNSSVPQPWPPTLKSLSCCK